MNTRVLLLGCLLAMASQVQSRDVYVWKDANGVTHYSDYPQPGARKITLNGTPSTSSTPSPVVAAKPAAPAVAPSVQYDALEIWAPENDESFFEPDVEIVVRIRPVPALDASDRLVTYLDGALLPGENVTEHRLSGVTRGTHSLASAIYGFDGKEKIRSAAVVFHMKQATVTNPRNQGSAVRPQPKPRPR